MKMIMAFFFFFILFTFNIPKKFSFIDVVFNSSYRKVLDNKIYEIYRQYNINYVSIEDTMTDLLLKNKKLLNEYIIIDFSYNNEVFINEVSDLIISFKANYNTEASISLEDKAIIYNFVTDHDKNKILFKIIINNNVTL